MTHHLTEIEDPAVSAGPLSAGVMLESDGTNLYATGDDELVEISHLFDGKWNRYVGVKVMEDDAGTFVSRHGESLKEMARCGGAASSARSKRETYSKLYFQNSLVLEMVKQAERDTVVATTSWKDESLVDESLGRWIEEPVEIVNRLSDPHCGEDERDSAVLFGATLSFNDSLRPALLTGLASYIDEFRFTEDEEKATLVGGAARCYGLNMDEPHFEDYAKWLVPEGSRYVSSSIELELVKGIHWRISYEPISEEKGFPKLCDALAEVALGYTNRRMVLQDNFASIASLSATSVFLLEAISGKTKHSVAIWKQTNATKVDFYIELLSEDLERIVDDIQAHDGDLAGKVGRHIEFVIEQEPS